MKSIQFCFGTDPRQPLTHFLSLESFCRCASCIEIHPGRSTETESCHTHVVCYDWRLSLSTVFSRLIHVVACYWYSVPFYSQILFHPKNMPHSFLSIRLLMDISVVSGFLHLINHAAMNGGAHVFIWFFFSISCGCIARIGIAGSYGNCVYPFEKVPGCLPVAAPWYISARSTWGVQFLSPVSFNRSLFCFGDFIG